MLRVAKGGKGVKDEKVESRHSERSEESLLGQSAMIEILRLPLRMTLLVNLFTVINRYTLCYCSMDYALASSRNFEGGTPYCFLNTRVKYFGSEKPTM